MRSFKKGSLFITLGVLMFTFAVLLCAYNRITEHQAAKTSEKIIEQLLPSAKNTPEKDALIYTENPNAEMPVKAVGENEFIGTLGISPLNLTLPVASEWSYAKLRQAPCRYTGSIYQNNLVICAHNYKKHFAKINALKIGDLITFTDMSGNVFCYKVSDIEQISPEFSSDITSGDWDLTLFTCTASGKNRICVRCTYEKTN